MSWPAEAVDSVGQACGLTGMKASDEPAARDMAEMLGRVANAPDPACCWD